MHKSSSTSAFCPLEETDRVSNMVNIALQAKINFIVYITSIEILGLHLQHGVNVKVLCIFFPFKIVVFLVGKSSKIFYIGMVPVLSIL